MLVEENRCGRCSVALAWMPMACDLGGRGRVILRSRAPNSRESILQDLSQPAARADVRPKVSAQLYEQLQDFNSITRRLHSYRHRNLRGLMTELRGQIPD